MEGSPLFTSVCLRLTLLSCDSGLHLEIHRTHPGPRGPRSRRQNADQGVTASDHWRPGGAAKASGGEAGLEQGRHPCARGGLGRGQRRRLARATGSGQVQRGRAGEDDRIPSFVSSPRGDASGFASQSERLGRAEHQPERRAPGAPGPPCPQHQRTAGRGSERRHVRPGHGGRPPPERRPRTAPRRSRPIRRSTATAAPSLRPPAASAASEREARASRQRPGRPARRRARPAARPGSRRSRQQARPDPRSNPRQRVDPGDGSDPHRRLDLHRRLGDLRQPPRPTGCSEQHQRLHGPRPSGRHSSRSRSADRSIVSAISVAHDGTWPVQRPGRRTSRDVAAAWPRPLAEPHRARPDHRVGPGPGPAAPGAAAGCWFGSGPRSAGLKATRRHRPGGR